MRAIILAAGRGSRMLAHTDDQPKCLVHWQGRAILDWQIQALHQVGIRDIGIVTGYRREKFPPYNLHEFINAHWARTSMVNSLMCADAWLSTHACLTLYSDIVYSPKAIVPFLKPLDTLGVASYSRWFELWSARFEDVLVDAESFRVDENGMILDIGSKTNDLQSIQGQFIGIMQFQPSSWKRFKGLYHELALGSDTPPDMTTVLGYIAAADRMPIRAVAVQGICIEFDSISDLAAAEPFAAEFRSDFFPN